MVDSGDGGGRCYYVRYRRIPRPRSHLQASVAPLDFGPDTLYCREAGNPGVQSEGLWPGYRTLHLLLANGPRRLLDTQQPEFLLFIKSSMRTEHVVCVRASAGVSSCSPHRRRDTQCSERPWSRDPDRAPKSVL